MCIVFHNVFGFFNPIAFEYTSLFLKHVCVEFLLGFPRFSCPALRCCLHAHKDSWFFDRFSHPFCNAQRTHKRMSSSCSSPLPTLPVLEGASVKFGDLRGLRLCLARCFNTITSVASPRGVIKTWGYRRAWRPACRKGARIFCGCSWRRNLER
jgi:hypothetical protein